MKRVAVLIEPNIGSREIEIGENEDVLEFMYKHIGCRTVELIRSDKGDLWVDEEGFYAKGSLVSRVFLDEKNEPLTIAGNILITKGGDSEGNTLFFNDDDRDLIEYWKSVRVEVFGTVKG